MHEKLISENRRMMPHTQKRQEHDATDREDLNHNELEDLRIIEAWRRSHSHEAAEEQEN